VRFRRRRCRPGTNWMRMSNRRRVLHPRAAPPAAVPGSRADTRTPREGRGCHAGRQRCGPRSPCPRIPAWAVVSNARSCEGPWLALIGVADDVLLVAGGCAAELPLVAGGETAPPSPAGRLGDGGDHVLGSHRQAAAQQRAVIGVTAEEHRPDVCTVGVSAHRHTPHRACRPAGLAICAGDSPFQPSMILPTKPV